MSAKYEFARVTMPGFENLVTESIINNAIVSLGILEKGIPCGVVCADLRDYHYTITWLYVDKKKRRKGYATALITELTSLIREAGETYPMQINLTSMDADILGFFENYEHFYVRTVGDIFIIPPGKRAKGKIYSDLCKTEGRLCHSYYEYSSEMKDVFLKRLQDKYPQFYRILRADIGAYKPDLTLAYGKTDIRAAVFVKEIEDKTLDISVLISDDVIALGMVLLSLIKAVESDYKDYSLRIITVNRKSKALVHKLFPEKTYEYLLQADWDLRLPGEYPAFGRKKN